MPTGYGIYLIWLTAIYVSLRLVVGKRSAILLCLDLRKGKSSDLLALKSLKSDRPGEYIARMCCLSVVHTFGYPYSNKSGLNVAFMRC